MSGHLCLKWNNHSVAFQKSFSTIQDKEKYCDATIVCQGKYFSVHKLILSTCSEYFAEIFDKMQCQHPYIVFKDIAESEMELLLNYMYQGEVNVVQERLPALILAAEALKVKGLAVSDDLPSGEDTSSGRKRSSTSCDDPQAKRRADRRESRDSNSFNIERRKECGTEEIKDSEDNEPRVIKEEPPDLMECRLSEAGTEDAPAPSENSFIGPGNLDFASVANSSSSSIIKDENSAAGENFDGQTSTWPDYGDSNSAGLTIPSSEMLAQDDMSRISQEFAARDVDGPCQPLLPQSSGPSKPLNSSSAHEGWISYHRVPKNAISKDGASGPPSTVLIFRCLFCNYESLKKINVQSHIMFKHTGEKPFPCTICPKRFTLKKDLNVHIRTHTGERPFHCPICSVTFRYSKQLKHHMIRTHTGSGL